MTVAPELKQLQYGLTSPASEAATVTPNDSTDLTRHARALYIGTAGNLSVILAGDDTDTAVAFANVPAGVLPISVKRVRATGTAASDIVALF